MGYINGKFDELRPCEPSSCVWSMPIRWPTSCAMTFCMTASDTAILPLMIAWPSTYWQALPLSLHAEPANPSTELLAPEPSSMSTMVPLVS
jgi:hypothetical protein